MNRQETQNKVNTKSNAVINKHGDRTMDNKLIAALAIFMIFVGFCAAGIPEPDMIFYGTVEIGGVAVTALESHAIIARISGTSTDVGIYNMGDNPNAGNNYVLRVKLEDISDLSQQSENTAIIGQSIEIFIRQPGGQELLAETVTITDRGQIQELNLSANGEINYGTDINGSGRTDLVDFAIFAGQWLQLVCDGTNNNCQGADFDGINGVDFADLTFFMQNWLQ